MMSFLRAMLVCLSVLFSVCNLRSADLEADVCVYGGTPAGICAAVAAQKEGKSVIVVEPSRWVGGILGGGILPAQDAPHLAAIGGLSKWVIDNVSGTNKERIDQFSAMLDREGVTTVYEYRCKSVEKHGDRIAAIVIEHAPPDERGIPVGVSSSSQPNKRIQAKVFIDASYEGTVMAEAGVSYAIGREPASQYNETYAGVQEVVNFTPVDPYVTKGDPSSGLLPHVEEDHGIAPGGGDDYTQAYNFRFYVTSDERFRQPIEPPADYDPADYELVGRYVEYLVSQGRTGDLWRIFPARKGDGQCNYQRPSLFSIAPLGVSRFYQDGDHATQARIWRDHFNYLCGLQHFMATDPRVPAERRQTVAAIGFDKRQHPDNNGYPTQLYIRVARRMLSAYVLTEADVHHETEIADPIGYAGYGIDMYPARRIVTTKNGTVGVGVEGNMFVGGSKGTGPYAIPYRMTVPHEHECANLIVPICYSASYVAYASSRMEPVYMIIGECSGIAAAMAIDANRSVQSISYIALRQKLLDAGQELPEPKGVLYSSAPLEIAAPLSGDVLKINTSERIAWSYNPDSMSGKITVSLSVDNGVTWLPVSGAAVPVSDMALEWRVPAALQGVSTATNQGILKVDDTQGRYSARVTGIVITEAPVGTEIIIDNDDPEQVRITGDWVSSSATGGFEGSDYFHDNNAAKGSLSVTYVPLLPVAGEYEVFARWTAHENRSEAVPISIRHAGGETPVTVDQRIEGGRWRSLGTFAFMPDSQTAVAIANDGTSGIVVADAVRWILVKPTDAMHKRERTGSAEPAAPGMRYAAGGVLRISLSRATAATIYTALGRRVGSIRNDYNHAITTRYATGAESRYFVRFHKAGIQ